MTQNKFIKALFNTMLFFAILHMIVLLVLSIISFKFSYLNAFSIIGLDKFIPGIDQGIVSFIISGVVALVVYFLFYTRSK